MLYGISADGTYAEVTGYTGTATRIKITESYNNLPIKAITEEAFSDNPNITSVLIPDSVTSIGNYAFYNCSKLANVYYSESEEDFAKIAIGSNNQCLTDVAKHYNHSTDE